MLPPIGQREVAMTTMTEKQRVAVEAQEGARREGVSLVAYAQAKGLVIRELYDSLACLRRKGLLPKLARKTATRFVSVRVQPGPDATPTVRPAGGVLCRILHRGGYLIECTQWPPPAWISAVMAGSADAAT
jgi:hypothetical protein